VTDLRGLSSPDAFERLAGLLRTWVPQQRWFAGKARDFVDLRLHDAVLLTAPGSEDLVLDVIVSVDYADGYQESYQVPLTGGTRDADGFVGELDGLALVDATFVAPAAKLLAALTHEAAERRTARGETLVRSTVDDDPVDLSAPRRMTAEQSNTSVVFGDGLIFKLFRRLEAGENPDVEITRALTEAGYPNAPRQRGAFGIRHGDGSVTALGVLSEFVTGGREGWALATAEVARIAAGQLPNPALREQFQHLGRAIADLHGALARTLGHRDAATEDLGAWVDAMRAQAEHVLATAQRRAPEATATVLARRAEVLEALSRLADEKATGPLTRIHGDLHLGQVLLDTHGRWQLLDFEGEPAKSLAQRRALTAPLRDVAGMLRSFDYAAAGGSGGDLSAVPAAAAQWRDDVRAGFLSAYLDEAAEHNVLPDDDASVSAQLDAFELDKAVYELGYELANRPAWVPIPVGGITRVLDRARL
jgi:maltokinase